ncbi:cupin-like domain-containing protein [Marinimicrobium alkaliphilum]|uniref:cupin-like domain-containing protein n=1 Tax=Marinimicrobium alkaliphilum TaxID=2202654 RepID=UPI000DB95086|nr:cupin-like domain-containing protein [Marinimicrobium alkaliphilum]
MTAALREVEALADVGAELRTCLRDAHQPLVFRGLVKHWPLVQAAEASAAQVDAYLRRFYRGEPVTVYQLPSEAEGRIFYNDRFDGFNFQTISARLEQLLDRLLHYQDDPQAPTLYLGSTLIDRWLPGLRADNDIGVPAENPLASIWIGNRSRVAAHFDFPDNLALCCAGRRRFTLFPPEQVENLYVGPLDLTPSGQPVSLVDMRYPDYQRFPKFREAARAALTVELAPGDALFIPSLWWHQVESLDSYNILINYWWRSTPGYTGTPMNALEHALLSIRALPRAQRRAWRALFDHYVFGDEDPAEHIPEEARGILGALDETTARRLRAGLLNKLNR